MRLVSGPLESSHSSASIKPPFSLFLPIVSSRYGVVLSNLTPRQALEAQQIAHHNIHYHQIIIIIIIISLLLTPPPSLTLSRRRRRH